VTGVQTCALPILDHQTFRPSGVPFQSPACAERYGEPAHPSCSPGAQRMKSFHNKVAAITGAGSGIGRALALDLARQGCQLALSDINAPGLQETVEQAKRHGVRGTQQVLDVADGQAMQEWAAQVIAEHGRVNLIFNNAGVAHAGTVEANELADYEWIMNINFWGVVHGTKAFLPHLRTSGAGHIINISSVFGIFAQPGLSAYKVPQYAVPRLTRSLRPGLGLAHRCRAGAVGPRW